MPEGSQSQESQDLNLEAQEVDSQLNARSETDYLKSDTDRVDFLLDKIQNEGIRHPDDMFLEIMTVLTEKDLVPELGKYYTFIYTAKTPHILYDQFPLIVCLALFKWGFRGFNYHLNAYRNYNWDEIGNNDLHIVYPNELQKMRAIPYQLVRLSD